MEKKYVYIYENGTQTRFHFSQKKAGRNVLQAIARLAETRRVKAPFIFHIGTQESGVVFSGLWYTNGDGTFDVLSQTLH